MSTDITSVNEEGEIALGNNGATYRNASAARKATLVSDNGTYLKVEGQAYRVPRSSHSRGAVANAHHGHISVSVGTTNSHHAAQQTSSSAGSRSALARRCSDAQTQSAESSFPSSSANTTSQPPSSSVGFAIGDTPLLTTTSATNNHATNNYCDAANGSAAEPPSSSVQVGVPSSSRGPSPVLLAPSPQPPAFFAPSPILSYGYDPTYCQPIGQAADGYQYELVRRPSMGAPELALPMNHVLRRPSTGAPYPPAPPSPIPPQYAPSLAPQPNYLSYGNSLSAQTSSLQGSFDSCGGPPVTPIFIHNAYASSVSPVPPAVVGSQPLSPRHLHGSNTNIGHGHQQQQQAHQQQGEAQYHGQHRLSLSAGSGGHWMSGSASPTAVAAASELPKLIHETSI